MNMRDLISLVETASAGASTAGAVATAPAAVSSMQRRKHQSITELQHSSATEQQLHMLQNHIHNVKNNSTELEHMLQQQHADEIPGWISKKITLANDYVESVTQWMRAHQNLHTPQQDNSIEQL